MPQKDPIFYHNNRYAALSACQHCEGVIRHERWCLALNPVVCYACEIIVSPDKLTIGDAIILDSLGVLWGHLRS
jgi:glycerol-3-phosphate cytidylyltransferase-like family protein